MQDLYQSSETYVNDSLTYEVESVEQNITYEDSVPLPNHVTKTIANLVLVSAIIWLLIAVYQIVVGLVLLVFGVGIATLGCGGWNIYACIRNFKHAEYVRNCNSIPQAQSIVQAYDNSLGNIIIFLFLNLFLGGGLGVVGAIFDLILRAYVLKHRTELGA